MFQREDWTLFRNVGTLGQRAGVTADAIPRLVAKELCDNALDAAAAIATTARRRAAGSTLPTRATGCPAATPRLPTCFPLPGP